MGWPGFRRTSGRATKKIAPSVIRRGTSGVCTDQEMGNPKASTAVRSAIAAFVGLGAIVTSWGCDDPVFACAEHRECDDAGIGGVCETNGFCSFAANDCASGRAYGDLAPRGIAGRCVPLVDPCAIVGVCDSTENDDAPTRDPETPSGAERRREPEPDDDSTEPAGEDAIALDGTLHCSNGERDDGESDIDCGGDCLACDACRACSTDDDCRAGTCDAGTCRTIEVVTLDWQVDCGSVSSLPVNIVVPPGEYTATALPSAASRWNNDGANGGLSWTYRIDCVGGELDELRNTEWYATPEDAFGGLVDRTTVVIVGSEGLRCGHTDSYCPDNRGAIAVQLTTVCP